MQAPSFLSISNLSYMYFYVKLCLYESIYIFDPKILYVAFILYFSSLFTAVIFLSISYTASFSICFFKSSVTVSSTYSSPREVSIHI